MLYVKTDELNEVVLSHTDPMDPEYGLGKTEEELRTEGYLFEFLEELPRPLKKEGFRGVTYCDGEKFWFDYKESGAVDLQAMSLKLEEVRTKDVARKQEMDQIRTKSETIEQTQASILLEQGTLSSSISTTESTIANIETQLGTTNDNLAVALEKADLAEQRAEAVDIDSGLRHESAMSEINMQKTNLQNTDIRLDIVDMTASDTLMEMVMTQMTVDMQGQDIMTHDGKITEQEGIVGMTEANLSEVLLSTMMNEMAIGGLQTSLAETDGKLLAAENELVTTKAELLDTQQRLAAAEADVAELVLWMAEMTTGGTTT